MKKLAVLLCLFILTACSSTTPTYPKWWQTPPTDNEQYLYGLGEGIDLQSAQQQALTMIAGKLQTQLSAQLAVRTQETNVAADQYADRKIRSQVTDLSLSHFQLLNTAAVGNLTQALVRVDRAALANNWQNEYQQLVTKVKAAMARHQDSLFQWWLRAHQTLADARHADALGTLQSLLSGAPYQQHWQTKLQQAIRNIPLTVSISGNNTIIRQQIINALSDLGLHQQACQQCSLTFRFKTTVTFSEMFGEQVATLTFNGQLLSAGDVIAEQQWQQQGSSVSDRQIAKKAAATLAAEKIRKDGLLAAFGYQSNNGK